MIKIKNVKSLKMKKKFGAHTHFSPRMLQKCCNITTTVNNPLLQHTNTTQYQSVESYGSAKLRFHCVVANCNLQSE